MGFTTLRSRKRDVDAGSRWRVVQDDEARQYCGFKGSCTENGEETLTDE